MADEFHICIARRGKSDRNKALKEAIEHAERDFEMKFGFGRNADWHISVSDPNATVCLQAVDYFLWAVQRFYERGESRFLDMLWFQIGEKYGSGLAPSVLLTAPTPWPSLAARSST